MKNNVSYSEMNDLHAKQILITIRFCQLFIEQKKDVENI